MFDLFTHSRDGMRLVRKVFLAGISIVWFSAYCSLQAQLAGILGHNGILPIDVFMARVQPQIGNSLLSQMHALPSVLWLHPYIGVEPDVMAEWVCLAGMAVAACCLILAVTTRGGGLAPLHFLLWSGYLSVFNVGQTFLSFQWDILLLEAGFIAMFLPPLLSPSSSNPPSPVPIWLLRFLLFKLMLMSGVVKVQSQCPTWLGLSALDYHFATQCIPTPLAWHAHNLTTPAMRALGVAATLWLEGPATFLLILPVRDLRVAGALLQVLLQVLIILTGNYNFFNFLTALLALACMDDATLRVLLRCRRTPPAHPTGGDAHPGGAALGEGGGSGEGESSAFEHRPKLARTPAKPKKAGRAAATPGSIRAPSDTDDTGSVAAAAADDGEEVEQRARGGRGGGGGRAGGRAHRAGRALLGAGAAALLAVSWARMFDVDISKGSVTLKMTVEEMDGWLALLLPPALKAFAGLLAMAGAGHAWHEWRRSRTFGAGLVRVLNAALMLAVAAAVLSESAEPLRQIHPSAEGAIPGVAAAWAGVPDSLRVSSGYGLFRRMTGVGADGKVARPEIVIEGADSPEGPWKPYEFRYKPGALSAAPRFIAPHQPRLDWQMWFAALGSYQHNPWFVSLVARILEGQPEVLALLDDAKLPFPVGRPPKVVRALLYSYDFSKPGVGDRAAWWRRTFDREYLPPLNLENESLQEFLGHHGLRRRDAPRRGVGGAVDGAEWPLGAGWAAAAGAAMAVAVWAVDRSLGAFLLESLEPEGKPKNE